MGRPLQAKAEQANPTIQLEMIDTCSAGVQHNVTHCDWDGHALLEFCYLQDSV